MRYAMSMILAATLCGAPAMLGCDKEVSHERTVTETSGGGVKVKEQTVTEHPDGSVSKTTETNRTNP